MFIFDSIYSPHPQHVEYASLRQPSERTASSSSSVFRLKFLRDLVSSLYSLPVSPCSHCNALGLNMSLMSRFAEYIFFSWKGLLKLNSCTNLTPVHESLFRDLAG